MAWKVEKWLKDICPRENPQAWEHFKNLTPRETAIVVAGSIDLALAELLSMRLIDIPNECEAFLGLDEDGRAPVGSFGARIDLALLTGVILPQDAKTYRSVKNIRNKFAHRIKVDFTSPDVVKLLIQLHDHQAQQYDQEPTAKIINADTIRPLLGTDNTAGTALLAATMIVNQTYLHAISKMVTRLQPVILNAQPGVRY